jgi:hypothetical protein
MGDGGELPAHIWKISFAILTCATLWERFTNKYSLTHLGEGYSGDVGVAELSELSMAFAGPALVFLLIQNSFQTVWIIK